jgi:isoquinoline 1-oxidoreductase beta subunit
MSRLGRITRRSFLVVSAGVAGGVAFGYYKYRQAPENPLVQKPGEAVFSPWVIVRSDGVSVITPRAEMGQGVQTTLAALVAEEMDLDWAEVRAEHGPAAAAYANLAVAAAGLPFPDYRDSTVKRLAEDAMDVMGKFMGVEATGGSTSMIDAFTRMRRAGAAARAVLVEAASRRLKQNVKALRTENGAVVAPDGTRLAYGELAAEAAGITPPANPPLKDPKAWRLLGKPLPRLDMLAKSTGTATFGIDIRLPGMLFASVRANPGLGAGMRSYDARAAKATPGVKAVVDLGGAIAVVATNTWTAFKALDSVQIEWEPAPYPATTPAIFDAIAKAFDTANSTLRDDGNVEKALSGAKALKAEYRVPYLAHATMEPMTAAAQLKNGRLTLWVPNQAPTVIRDKCAAVVGLPADKVTVNTPFLGGGFGRRSEFDYAVQAAKLARALDGTPVLLTWRREEDMGHDFYRPGAIARMEGVAGKDGPVALKAAVAAPSVYRMQAQRALGFAPPGPDKILVEGLFDQPYGIPNYRVSGHISDVAVPVGSWRSVGNSHNAFFQECFLDELAHEAGLDPVEMRLKLMQGQSARATAVVKAVAEMAGWGGTLANDHARGMAFCWSFGTPTAEIVEISRSDAGIRLEKMWIAQDVGLALDPRNIEAQMISGAIYGLTAAVMGEITFDNGAVKQQNFFDYDALRLPQVPVFETKILASLDHPTGVGEPGTPPAAPALANAVFALTGKRIRELPLNKAVSFVS